MKNTMRRRAICLEVASLFWILIYVKCASSIVPAPTNVSVVCNNFQPVVSWTYSQSLLDPLFRVYISPIPTSQGSTKVNQTTRDLQLSLGIYVWRSLMSSRDVYTVDVSAVSGDQESARTTSKSFTFNTLHSQGTIRCTLKLPPVELQVIDGAAIITFKNPMKVHQELHWAADIQDSDPLTLSFEVTENNVTHGEDCHVHDQKCTLKFSLASIEEEYCFSIKSKLWNQVQSLSFKQEDQICGRPVDVSDSFMLFLGLLLVLFVAVVASIGFMVWKAQACVRSSPALPKPLDSDFWQKLRDNILDLPNEQVCFISEVRPRRADGGAEEHPEGGEEHREGDGREEYHEGEMGEEYREEEGVEEVPFQGYEPRGPPLVPMDMGGGDIVLGYGP